MLLVRWRCPLCNSVTWASPGGPPMVCVSGKPAWYRGRRYPSHSVTMRNEGVRNV